MNKKGIKGIVWGKTLERALLQLERIKSDYTHANIEIIKEQKNHCSHYILFSNGDEWYAVRAVESQRGRRCNVSFIDDMIDTEIVNTVIKPITKMLPFSIWQYYKVEYNYGISIN